MDEKLTQAMENPVLAADQAPKETPTEAPNATAEQGEGSALADTPSSSNPSSDVSKADVTKPHDEVPASQLDASEPTEGSSSDAKTAVTAQADDVKPDAPAQSDDATASGALEVGATAAAVDNDVAITMEDVLAASDEQLARPPIHRGMIVTGTVIMLAQEGIVIDVGAKIEGMLPYNQLFEFDASAAEASKYFKPGDEIQVYVVRADIPNNTIILSKKRADQERAWNLLQDIFDKKLPVEVEIVEKVRGGLVANLGVRAFLPASQIDIRRINDLTPYVGKRLKVKIIELNRKRNRVIVSRRAILEEEVEELKAETLKKLEPGYKTEGEVVEITDFGVFVNLGGVDGLVHRSELTHGRFNHPKEVVKVGDKVKVEVLDMDLERERINLSIKKLIPNPWEEVLLKYSIGQRVSGKVTNLTPFGAFVEIEPGLEGLIHVSEMSWTKRIRHPKEIVSEGDEVEAMILKIDSEQERISLGLRQTQPDPWSSLPDRYPPGTQISGPITGITDFGVFMEIEEGIEGLVHISELAHEHIDTIEEHFKKGDEISAVILNIDPVEQRASLSRKRLLPYTGPSYDDSDMAAGGAQSRGGSRKGRRGGRRNQVIDYDYSYAASDTSNKATTKLGDVYADLFAQFGLTDTKTSSKAETKSETKADAQADTPAPKEAAAETPQPAPAPEAAAPAESKPEQAAKQAQASVEEDIDPENAIDAAEAAALLTAAFREGKRPVKSDDATTEATEDNEKAEA
jgi:small subunit ribosomal protein S1